MQKNLTKKFIQTGKVIVIALAFGLGVGFVSASWTPPSAVVPGCSVTSNPVNCDGPINVSGAGQSRSGALNLTDTADPSALNVNNGVVVGTLANILNNGAPGIVSFLESTSNWDSAISPSIYDAITILGGGTQGDSGIYSLGNINVLGNIIADFKGDSTPDNANFYMPLDLAPTLSSFASTPLNIDLSQNTGASASEAINIDGNTQTGAAGIIQNVPNFFFYDSSTSSGATLEASKLQLQDGTQGAGKVLTSDANGLSSWGTLPATVPDTYAVVVTEVQIPPPYQAGVSYNPVPAADYSTTGGGVTTVYPVGGSSYTTPGLEGVGGYQDWGGYYNNMAYFNCPSDYPIMLSAGGNCLTGGHISTLAITSHGTGSNDPGQMILDCDNGPHASDSSRDVQQAQYLCMNPGDSSGNGENWTPVPTAIAGSGHPGESCANWLGVSSSDVGIYNGSCTQSNLLEAGYCLYQKTVKNTSTGNSNQSDVAQQGDSVQYIPSSQTNNNTLSEEIPESSLSTSNNQTTFNSPDNPITCYYH